MQINLSSNHRAGFKSEQHERAHTGKDSSQEGPPQSFVKYPYHISECEEKKMC